MQSIQSSRHQVELVGAKLPFGDVFMITLKVIISVFLIYVIFTILALVLFAIIGVSVNEIFN